MKISLLSVDFTQSIIDLMDLGAPYVKTRTDSDYWLYATHFSSTCPVALDGAALAGAIVAFRSQDHPSDIYVQDVMVHPNYRRRGVAVDLMAVVRKQAGAWGCARLYLTSEPDNFAAQSAWLAMGFQNKTGDYSVDGVSITRDFKGRDKDRAVYEMKLP